MTIIISSICSSIQAAWPLHADVLNSALQRPASRRSVWTMRTLYRHTGAVSGRSLVVEDVGER